MSIYDNETKIYPDLNPAKLSEIEAFFLKDIEECEQKAKKKKRSITILSNTDTGLSMSIVLTGGTSIGKTCKWC